MKKSIVLTAIVMMTYQGISYCMQQSGNNPDNELKEEIKSLDRCMSRVQQSKMCMEGIVYGVSLSVIYVSSANPVYCLATYGAWSLVSKMYNNPIDKYCSWLAKAPSAQNIKTHSVNIKELSAQSQNPQIKQEAIEQLKELRQKITIPEYRKELKTLKRTLQDKNKQE